MVVNLRKAQKKWARILRILGWEGGNTRVSGIFFKVVVQAVLLFVSETWMMTPCMVQDLGGFQNRLQNGSWEYPPLEEVIWEEGLEEVEAYVLRRQNTVLRYILTLPIMDLCSEVLRRPGTQVSKRWWVQEGLYLEGVRVLVGAEDEGVPKEV